ncbi:hypothetical protein BPAE_0176g00070 [Botrytis paeoniae]|uniref:Uncharacterized protein n=1 Tax=Botrytis paeoniae TaxID=278948 RepID=A0A4Z1FHC3_9HELO|nr:hypothetical protein BPAE_0176g00070 [Botrytis paeoniae]
MDGRDVPKQSKSKIHIPKGENGEKLVAFRDLHNSRGAQASKSASTSSRHRDSSRGNGGSASPRDSGSGPSHPLVECTTIA